MGNRVWPFLGQVRLMNPPHRGIPDPRELRGRERQFLEWYRDKAAYWGRGIRKNGALLIEWPSD